MVPTVAVTAHWLPSFVVVVVVVVVVCCRRRRRRRFCFVIFVSVAETVVVVIVCIAAVFGISHGMALPSFFYLVFFSLIVYLFIASVITEFSISQSGRKSYCARPPLRGPLGPPLDPLFSSPQGSPPMARR